MKFSFFVVLNCKHKPAILHVTHVCLCVCVCVYARMCGFALGWGGDGGGGDSSVWLTGAQMGSSDPSDICSDPFNTLHVTYKSRILHKLNWIWFKCCG